MTHAKILQVFAAAPLASFERKLYDNDFLDSNCELSYDEDNKIDNLEWTGNMNFIIFAVTLLAGSAVWYKSERKRADQYIAGFLIMASISYGLIPGIVRKVVDRLQDGFVYTLPQRIGLIGMHVAHMLLMYAGVRSVSGKLSATDCWKVFNVIAIICAFFNLAVIIVFVGFLIGIFMLGVFTFQAIKKNSKVWIKALAMAVSTVALIEQSVLAKSCGDAAYENCFQDCPLPNPKVFNHNALQIVIFIVAFVLLALGEIKVPASSLYVAINRGVPLRAQAESVAVRNGNSVRLETVKEEDFVDDDTCSA
mmetsp:Transcript_14044/g.21010  ORF Transcript_14044/g.21010 Transcript_14044/m.21010 type:complete len:308 (+) Transcript_14044:225-1148(+)